MWWQYKHHDAESSAQTMSPCDRGWAFGESKNWTYCYQRKDLNQYHSKRERSI